MRQIAAFVVIVMMLFVSVGIGSASGEALPGEALYPVKTLTEGARVAFTLDPTAHAVLHLRLAGERLGEAQALSARGRLAAIPSVLEAYMEHLQAALDLARTHPEALPAMAAALSQQSAALEALNVGTSAAAQTALNAAAQAAAAAALTEPSHPPEPLGTPTRPTCYPNCSTPTLSLTRTPYPTPTQCLTCPTPTRYVTRTLTPYVTPTHYPTPTPYITPTHYPTVTPCVTCPTLTPYMTPMPYPTVTPCVTCPTPTPYMTPTHYPTVTPCVTCPTPTPYVTPTP